MNLANVGALWWLLPLGGAVLALYLLKMRRKDLRVPASFLWPARTEEVRANSLFQKLRWNLLLFLQLLALCLLILGLARPQVRQKGFGGKVTVIVIDTSASMGASDVKPTRFDEAMRICRDLVSSAGASDRVSVIEAGPTPRVVFPLSNDAAKMRSALGDITRTDADANVGEALRLAASLTAHLESAQIILLSDGVFPEVHNFSAGNAAIDFRKIGVSSQNTAITALGVSESTGGSEAYCGLKNFGKDPASGALTLTADGKVFDSRRVRIGAESTFGVAARPPVGAKVIEARLEIDDDLEADNYAVTVNDPHAKVKTLLIGKGNIFLERALALDPRVVLDRAEALPASEKSNSSAYDLIVFDGVKQQRVKSKAVICFGAAGEDSPVTRLGAATTPTPTTSKAEHPLMEAVDLRGTYIDTAEKVRARGVGEVLAESDQGPLVVFADGAQKRLYVAFEPMRSDFPLQPSFPIFLSNAVNRLVPRETVSSAMAIRAGQPFSVPARSEDSTLVWSGDDGDVELKPTAGVFVVREARRVGAYEMKAGDFRQRVLATIGSLSESAIAPQNRILLGRSSVAGRTQTTRMGDFWRIAAFIGLAVLAVEWWLFARRS